MTARVQENRTATPNQPPANNSLQVGELYVEMATPLRLWTGVPTTVDPTGRRLVLDSTAQAAANTAAVQKAGDTMTGPLVLSGQPTTAAQAANKAYVDGTAVQKAGDTMTGPLVLSGQPTTPTQAANKAYVDGLLNSPTFTGDPKAPTPVLGDNDTSIATTAFVANTIAAGPPAGAVIGTPAPTTVMPGTLWWDSVGGQLYVRYDDGNSVQWVTACNVEGLANAATKTDVATALNNTGRNLIHNPLFNVAQRGVGPWTASGLTADRWSANSSDTFSVSIAAAADAVRTAVGDEAAQYFIANTFTGSAAAGAFIQLIQRIENVRRLGNKTVVVSFWANCGAGALKLGVSLDQSFGTGGSPSSVVSGAGQAVTLSTTWTRYTLTFNVPSTSGKTIGTNGNDYTVLNFWYNVGSTYSSGAGFVGPQSGSINIWGVQLEIGSQVTPLEKPDPRYDLSNCQRFYQTEGLMFAGYGAAGGPLSTVFNFAGSFRAVPTIAFSGTTYSNTSGINGNALSTRSVQVNATVTATGNAYVTGGYITASADL